MYKIEIEKPAKEKLDKLGVTNWGIWEKENSAFDWEYDSDEICYILDGNATVKTEWEEVSFGTGDLVKFPKGLKCVWTITKPIRKHYNFS
ncbi:cupin domain-containing protein [Candidatus Auribacterota bacterium]